MITLKANCSNQDSLSFKSVVNLSEVIRRIPRLICIVAEGCNYVTQFTSAMARDKLFSRMLYWHLQYETQAKNWLFCLFPQNEIPFLFFLSTISLSRLFLFMFNSVLTIHSMPVCTCELCNYIPSCIYFYHEPDIHIPKCLN